MNRFNPLTLEEHKKIGAFLMSALFLETEIKNLMKKSIANSPYRSREVDAMFAAIIKQWHMFSQYCDRDMHFQQRKRLSKDDKEEWKKCYDPRL